MKIKSVKIENFRSIENVTIDFKENLRVLVGINESGKTNILEALRLISPGFSAKKDDVRIPEKGIVEKSEILFRFEFEENELEEIYQKTQQKILLENSFKPLVEVNNEKLNFKELIQKFYNEGFYKIEIKNNKKIPTRLEFNKKIEFICNLKKPKSVVNFTFQNKKGEKFNISNFKLIDSDSYPEISTEYLEETTPEVLDDIIGTAGVIEMVNKNLPKVIYWKYDENHLLPPSIPISNFTSNPNSYPLLKNMFLLSGIPEGEIAQRIIESKQTSHNDFRTLLRQVSKASTEYFKDAWPEYKNIKFSLNPNGENIDCGIDEKTIQDFKRRSDGFKRFITILLLLSIPAKKGLLKNNLILIDEADQSLHPSGCKYLMQQLLKIAQNNYVMYSTHSIFMIDSENIQRHYIVEKKNEITTIREASEENYRDEEVIYRALGASVYEILEKKNILFEGWTDKKLFEVAIKKDKSVLEFFSNIGISHAIGVKSIKNITPILEWSQRKVFIVTDGDQISQQEQKKFINNKGYGIWKRYDELFNRREIVTVEDFIKKEALKEVLNIKLKELNIEIDQNFQLPKVNRFNYIKNYIKDQLVKKNIVDNLLEEFIEKFKQSLFSNLRFKDIEDDYFDFIKILQQEIENL